jgi:hypothetical protein
LAWKQNPIFKITRTKKAEGIAQSVEGMPSKHKALSSNSSTAKKKKEEEKEEEEEGGKEEKRRNIVKKDCLEGNQWRREGEGGESKNMIKYYIYTYIYISIYIYI